MKFHLLVNFLGDTYNTRGLVSAGAAGAFAPAEIFNGCNAPVLRGIVCTKDLKSKETLGNLWLLENILHPSCRDPNEAPGYNKNF